MDCEGSPVTFLPADINMYYFYSLVDEIVDNVFKVKSVFNSFQQEVHHHDMIPDDQTSDTSDNELRAELEGLIESEEEGEGNPETKYKTRNEIKAEPIAKDIEETLEQRLTRYTVDLSHINNLEQIGIISSILSDVIVIQSKPEKILDLDNIIFTDSMIPLGKVDDVFGRIEMPSYTVAKDKFLATRILEGEIKVGDHVYIDTKHSKVLPMNQINYLKSLKGTDASNKFDEEVLYQEEIEFSDDEKEEEYKHKITNRKTTTNNPIKPEKKKNIKFENKQRNKINNFHSNTVYNQGVTYMPVPNTFMNPQQMHPMQLGMMLPMNNSGMMAQQMFFPMANMPLAFNPNYNNNQMMQQQQQFMNRQFMNMQNQQQQFGNQMNNKFFKQKSQNSNSY